MVVHVFGCSFSHGIHYNNRIGEINWVRELAKKRPDIEFHNRSLVGASLPFCLAQLRHTKNRNSRDVFVFQVTFPYRFCSWDQKTLLKHFKQKDPNYYAFTPSAADVVQKFGPNWNTKYSKDDRKFYQTLLEKTNDLTELATYISTITYAQQVCDFVYIHKRHYNTDLVDNVHCVEDILGETKFNQYIHDDGFHFNREGCKWVADWIEQNIKHKLIR